MRFICCAAAALLFFLQPALLTSQESAARFEIGAVGDSTLTFEVGKHDWIEVGQRGIVVDPQRRDALVARFHIIEVSNGQATALVTGQTMRVTPDHVALLNRPPVRFYRHLAFWAGALIGAVAGVAGALVVTR